MSREDNAEISEVFIDRQFGLDLGLTYGIYEGFELSIAMPVGYVVAQRCQSLAATVLRRVTSAWGPGGNSVVTSIRIMPLDSDSREPHLPAITTDSMAPRG